VKSVLLYACEAWKVAQRIISRLQGFINRCLRCIINIYDQKLYQIKIVNFEPTTITIQIKRIKWHWIGHALRKPTGSIEKSVLDWNTKGARRRGLPKKTWKRTIEDEAMKAGKTWSEVKRLGVDRTRWRRFTDALCSRGSNRN
jgi:hypothetical protein